MRDEAQAGLRAAGPRVDGERLWASLERMAQIGATPKGGVCRLALTDLDRESRDLFVQWARDARCTVRVDKMGNVFARRAGRRADAAPVMTGSHADSQPTGGRYDGIYGVLGGLEVVRALNDAGIETVRPIDVVIWTNEEGSRFAPAMVSAGVFAGVYSLEYGLSRADAAGRTIGDELERIGYAGTEPVGGYPVHAAYELHIEQGAILERAGKTIGVVTAGQGQRWYEVTLTGIDAHAGTTPMEFRRDALVGAARMIAFVDALGRRHAPHARATVGMIDARPNSRNTVPGGCFFTVEFRHPDDAVLDELDAALRAELTRLAAETGLGVQIEQIFTYPPVPFAAACIDAVRDAAESLGLSHMDIVSGAGHDACYIARVAPTGMIFVPCVDGLSHNEAEAITPEWATAGADVLLRAVLKSAQETGA
ncbi:Zn-dependent hydrolase [Burkholderia multivorans]|uniref:Zn-dependent hydrolase n=1 Tax=Burkholderia multivorans TaxID=87883 RepID=UPI0019D21D11|nr:Zn-dependent hydrolase [Burkholderia multivorans]MBN6732298.1 Zn-dependent hydrolase [Burkholderia multivorans]MBN6734461.1 Zn-dependent hydrolase [Burkholderia multivorans]MBN7126514.1 Zn-dependent hydrolase [Burkholderia multivorans]MBN8166115.1 Zn-dependent hydrolase [Burkholderia multivorans]MBN8171904.1 Zn-dependent hydrolase [Burkholderia multivorans]